VEGLSEKRPSVMIGDTLLVTLYGEMQPTYKGNVEYVFNKEVCS